jgi:hypothetical protein
VSEDCIKGLLRACGHETSRLHYGKRKSGRARGDVCVCVCVCRSSHYKMFFGVQDIKLQNSITLTKNPLSE